MVFNCIVLNCQNNSTKSSCYYLKWHRVPASFDSLRRYMRLPNDLDELSPNFKNMRICSLCMSKVPKNRKSPLVRSNALVPQRRHVTISELRYQVDHDHNYAKRPDDSSMISVLAKDESITLPKELPVMQKFCIEMFSDDDDAISFYTSFPTYSHFMICYEFLGEAANHLIYSGSKTDPHQIPRLKTQRALSSKNEFFLTLCRLRCNLMEKDLSFRFCISQSTVSRIFTTWINFLYHKFKDIPIWPSRLQVQAHMPVQFKNQYPNTRIILDATEIFIQKPSDPTAQQVTFSSYKNHNTAKALAGITPSGAFSFISSLYGGSISDRELFVMSGLLEKLEPGDSVMVDKGFNIQDLLESKGVQLNIPPRKNNGQLSNIELVETRRVASLRIHIERAFKRVKEFKILSNLPNNMAGLSSEIFYVCSILTNFQTPLVLDKTCD